MRARGVSSASRVCAGGKSRPTRKNMSALGRTALGWQGCLCVDKLDASRVSDNAHLCVSERMVLGR